jgi:hypothetical protein
MGNYRVRLIESMDDWDLFRNQWNDLMDKSAASNIFLTWEWLYSWAQCFIDNKRVLFILMVYEDDVLVGIAPWCIRKINKGIFSIRQLEFIGTPEAGSDYLDVFMKKGREKEVSNCLYDILLGDFASRWDRIRLEDMPSNSLFLLYFHNRIKEKGKYVDLGASSFCPVVSLLGTEEQFFAGLSSKRVQRFRQDLRTLNKQAPIAHVTFSSGTTDTALKDFFILYNEKSGRRCDELFNLILKFMEKRGAESIQIDFISAEQRYVAGLLHLRYHDTLYMYLMSTDKTYSPKTSIGNLLIGLCISNAINSGISCYDFLKGDEAYKFHWTNFGRRSISILFPQRKFLPIFLTLADLAKSAGKVILR